jgi:hypothetical protein
MKNSKAFSLIMIITLFYFGLAKSQPIPVELMLGNKNGTVNFVFGRNFKETSKFGFFHMNTIQFGIQNKSYNDFIMQHLFLLRQRRTSELQEVLYIAREDLIRQSDFNIYFLAKNYSSSVLRK